MTAFSVRGAARRGEVVVTVDGDAVAVADQSTGEVVWQRSGPGIHLELADDELDIDGAIRVRVPADQVSRTVQLITRYRNSIPSPEAGDGSGMSAPAPPSAAARPLGSAEPVRTRQPTQTPFPPAAPVPSNGTPPGYMNELCDRLHRAANVVQIIALLIGVLGIIGGVVVAVDTDDMGNHMYVTEGVALVFASVVQAAVLYLFGVWGVAWAARNRMAR